MRVFLILSLLVLPLSACKTMVQDGPTKVIVDDGEHAGPYDDKHCPPGHHMKGWC